MKNLKKGVIVATPLVIGVMTLFGGQKPAAAFENGLTQMGTDVTQIGSLGENAVKIGGGVMAFVLAATIVHKVAAK